MALFETLHVYASAELRGAAMNMAIDEALLEVTRVPALRFYAWQQPSISFGYFGRFADVANEQSRRDIVRRWTGGGIVFHGEDVTYSLVLPVDVAARFHSSRLIYSEVHGAIRRALGAGSAAALAAVAAPKISEACFANPVEADVLLNGRKIAGAAQRRTRSGLLHQGSIQHDALPARFQHDFARALCPAFEEKELGVELLERAAEIAQLKYATSAWLHLR
jgi:lipoyl(octanoyl) transferase